MKSRKRDNLGWRAVAAATLFTYSLTTLSPSLAWAALASEEATPARSRIVDEVSAKDVEIESPDRSRAADAVQEAQDTAVRRDAVKPSKDELKAAATSGVEQRPDGKAVVNTSDAQVAALPTGGDKSGVTSQAISVPKGSGTVQGMGESFSAQLSTGIATFSVPFSLPAARGGAQPSLGLSYSSSSGSGLAGMGWSVGVPYIARQTDRGLPGYDDQAAWHPNQDRFVFNGGQELVPICLVGAGGSCSGQVVGESMPAWAAGYQYFRPRVEGSFLRFFWSPDHRTWRVQDKSGVTMELGVPLDGSGYSDSLEVNPDKQSQIFRWHLARQYDAYCDDGTVNCDSSALPKPRNVVVYRYAQDGGQAYLSDIYDTTPATAPTDTGDLGLLAHRTHLEYEARPDPTETYHSGWLITSTKRLVGVAVLSKSGLDTSGERTLVRRYHLSYDGAFHTSYLTNVQVEGRCAGTGGGAVPTESQVLAGSTDCDALPPMSFQYSHVKGFNTAGSAVGAGLAGYEAVDARLQQVGGSPPHSIDEELTDYFDINADGLPDVLVTAPGTYGNDYGVFFNSDGGVKNTFGDVAQLGVQGVLGANSGTIKLSNQNVAALDADGDGIIDFLHMPQVRTYAVYHPQLVAGRWKLVGRAIDVANRQSPKVDLGKDADLTKLADVNGDGLVDVVVSKGTQFQTFFSAGRLPGGDMQFGHGSWATKDTATISNDPIAQCVPYSGLPVQFGDSEIQLADMNGDGYQDIVRLRRGELRYWPGRGNGFWGTGKLDDCPAGTYGDKRSVTMDSSPYYSDIQGTSLRLDDVNGDGFDDLVQVRFDAVDVYLNVDGHGWTARHIIDKTPASPSYANRVRLIDINGSGTRDIVWGDGKKYQFMDLDGGVRPGLLTRVENGLGKSTDIEYGTSTAEMLAAERTGVACEGTGFDRAWCSKMPTVTHLVKRVTESDNLSVAGSGPSQYVTEYSYRDPVYEGRQREFRGFKQARSKRVGDANSPTDFTESTFLLGECEDETPDNGVDDCSLAERWRDNPKEALKGLPVVTERYDASGLYLSTEATTYRLRHLYTGLDGRAVRHAFQAHQRSTVYDTNAPTTAAGFVNVPAGSIIAGVQREDAPPAAISPASFAALQCSLGNGTGALPAESFDTAHLTSVPVPLRATTGYATTESVSYVDAFGNALVAVSKGCVEGDACPVAQTGNDADELICSFTRAAPLQSWQFRTDLTWVAGSVNTAARKQTSTSYDALGAPTQTTAQLTGSVGLLRRGPAGWTIQANPPATASANGTRVLGTREYDPFGNLKREKGPGAGTAADLGRCRSVTYDTGAYQQLPLSETIYTGGCDKNGLTTTAVYDRGLGLVTSVEDMNQLTTSVAYDSFGRLTSLTRPTSGGNAGPTTAPSVLIDYSLPSPQARRAFSVIHTRTQDGSDEASSEYLESYSFVDGMGRARVGLAEADHDEDGHYWVVSSIAEFDAKGAVRRKYLPSFLEPDVATPDTSTLPVSDAPPQTQYGRQRYDAFGRQVQTYDVDGTVTLQSKYHALSTDLYDAADIYPGPHQGSYATTRTDGHGRTVESVERVHDGGSLDVRYVRTQYLPTGEPITISRVRTGSPTVMRWMRYDSLGRLILNVDPHTTANFSATITTDPSSQASGMKPWIYAYNDAGDLVGTSDARGCGQNFYYDGAGRLYGEDYSPCDTNHWSYTNPNVGSTPYDVTTLSSASQNAFEVFYQYDGAPTAATGPVAPPGTGDDYYGFVNGVGGVDTKNLKGKLAAVHDRAATTWFAYDARGRGTKTWRKVSYVAAKNIALFANRFVNKWYHKTVAYDAADRPIDETTGVTSTELKASDGTSSVRPSYTKRGTIKKVGSSYGDLVKSIKRTADGLVTDTTFGDAAATTTHTDFDSRRRAGSVQTFRSAAPLWSDPAPPLSPAPGASDLTRQLLLEDLDYGYDIVGNPTEIRDWRTAEEWPAGAKPVTRRMEYDDLYRVTRVDYEYPGGFDKWKSVHAGDVPTPNDPRRQRPNGERIFDKRPLWQTYKYDWLGNTTQTDDDQHALVDRSLGNITSDAATGRPYQFAQGNSLPGNVTQVVTAKTYDDAGNLTWFTSGRSNSVTCTVQADCTNWQFFYVWDEVGRLFWSNKVGSPQESVQYLYDYNDERVVKQYSETVGSTIGPAYTTLYIFDSLELRRAVFDTASKTYPVNSTTEVAYLAAHGMRLARLHYEANGKGEPQLSTAAGVYNHSANLHVFFSLPDHLGSHSLTIDQASGELVEARTYQPYGVTESDYRPDRWKGFREDYGFTGKEEDLEAGLIYFGKRYFSPYLGRWASADPLAVHSPGSADLNLYAYVNGQVLQNIDPLGLDGEQSGADRLAGAKTVSDAKLQEKGVLYFAYPPKGSARAVTPCARDDQAAQEAWAASLPEGVTIFKVVPTGGMPLEEAQQIAELDAAVKAWFERQQSFNDIVDDAQTATSWVPGAFTGLEIARAGTNSRFNDKREVLEQRTGEQLPSAGAVWAPVPSSPKKYAPNEPPEGSRYFDQERTKSKAQMEKEFENREGHPWPADPASGKSQDAAHRLARGEGGTDSPRNIRPKPHREHMEKHDADGDISRMQNYRRWLNQQGIKWKNMFRRK